MDYIKLYTDFLKKFLKPKKKIKVVFDCSNGVASLVLKKLFKSNQLINCILINQRPDGRFPAHGPNPMLKGVLSQLQKEVKKQKADLGAAFDGDGDRVFFVDDRGRLIDPNESGYLLTQVFKPPYVVGVVSSQRLKQLTTNPPSHKATDGRGNKRPTTFISRIGHSFAKQLMRKKKANLGLEHSGHYFFKEFFYADSGILAAIEIINFISKLDGGVANWLDSLPKYYRSGELNFEVKDKISILKKIEKKYKRAKKSKLDGLSMEFDWGWFNIRPSNTEPLLRLNMEAMSKKVLNEKLKEVRKLITNH